MMIHAITKALTCQAPPLRPYEYMHGRFKDLTRHPAPLSTDELASVLVFQVTDSFCSLAAAAIKKRQYSFAPGLRYTATGISQQTIVVDG